MGFEIGGKTALLHFEEGTFLDGATVRVSLDMSLRDFLSLQRMADVASNQADSEAQTNGIYSALQRFGDEALVDWDLTLHGEPVPASGEGVMMLAPHVGLAVFQAWGQVVSSLGPNSSAASVNGASEAAIEEPTAA
jgi:hypothetical protein